MTGSAIAIPLLAASGAGAAEASTWDRVAECESGGQWSANLGNGSYGGLQLTQEAWDSFGGAEYAASPDLASRSQQILIAEKVLEAQGTKAWSSCATVSGLTKGIAGVVGGVVEGVTGSGKGDQGTGQSGSGSSASPGTGSSASDDQGDTQTDEPTTSGSSSTPAPGATGSASPSGSGTTEPSKGKHRGAAANEDGASADSGTEREPDDRASRGGGSGRTGGSLTGVTGGEEAGQGESVVVGGESLSVVIGTQKVAGGWV
ncbi:transglycosylase family protein [Streptomyces sp. NBC_01429]|uniref:transglycosylase family protein n=1 Tax=Streptomyces sp. NBC_01429 TaxID=2903862 RepID=UPI002E2A65A4|nr:transglycosylase family protein [Streptomyces sp. NBC_01429]